MAPFLRIPFLLIMFLYLSCSAIPGQETVQMPDPADLPFVHPGMMETRENLDFVKRKIGKGEEPWASAFLEMKDSDFARLDRLPQPFEEVYCEINNEPNIGGTEFYNDGSCAYTCALMWYMTGDHAYARKSEEYINAWSHTLKSFRGANTKLKIGCAGIKFLNAAEILKNTMSGWADNDIAAFEDMIMMWYGLIEDFAPTTNGNWDAAMGQTMMCIGIFLDRRDIFMKACRHLSYGRTLGAVNYYFTDTGQCQESGRDYGHVQMGISYLGNACEIAWNQGVDMYSLYDNRVMLGFEHASKYMLGHDDVPYEGYIDFDGVPRYADKPISKDGRGQFKPVYEVVYNHYHHRCGWEMPWTGEVIARNRNECNNASSSNGDGFMPWNTLMRAKGLVPGDEVEWPGLDMKDWPDGGNLPDGFISFRQGHEIYYCKAEKTFRGNPAVSIGYAAGKGSATILTSPYVELGPGLYEVSYYLSGNGYLRSVSLCTEDVEDEERRRSRTPSDGVSGTVLVDMPLGETVRALKFSDWRMCRSVFEVTKSGRYSINFCANNRNENDAPADPSDPLVISCISAKKIRDCF